MEEAVQNTYKYLNVSVDGTIKMATSRVANVINMVNEIGKIKTGFTTSFVQFNDHFANSSDIDHPIPI
jgi:N-acetylglucosamine-6-phosphate deacetylase